MERIGYDALAEVPRLISGAHSLVDGFNQGPAAGTGGSDHDLGPLFHKYDGQSRVLAQGDLILDRKTGVLDQLPQNPGGTRIRLSLRRPRQCLHYVRRQFVTSLHA